MGQLLARARVAYELCLQANFEFDLPGTDVKFDAEIKTVSQLASGIRKRTRSRLKSVVWKKFFSSSARMKKYVAEHWPPQIEALDYLIQQSDNVRRPERIDHEDPVVFDEQRSDAYGDEIEAEESNKLDYHEDYDVEQFDLNRVKQECEAAKQSLLAADEFYKRNYLRQAEKFYWKTMGHLILSGAGDCQSASHVKDMLSQLAVHHCKIDDSFRGDDEWLTKRMQQEISDIIEFFKLSNCWPPCVYCEKPVLYQYVTDGMREFFGFTEDFYTTDINGYRHHCSLMEPQDELRKSKRNHRIGGRKIQGI